MSRLRALFSAAAALLAATAVCYMVTGAPKEATGQPPWTEITWPFATDQWGRGRAYQCNARSCGSRIELYLRAKIGFCNCASEIDDDEMDRAVDLELIGGAAKALARGQAIVVNGMKGRARVYIFGGSGSALAIALHDRCDMIVATAAVESTQPEKHEQRILEFLSTDVVRQWAETTLGL